ncbi:MAG: cyclic nucleotide-binding domain-containing protein, partial [Pseudonocardia sp.]|nr:cyclic nucleotide-binding domain-containing protein [Pseudonocardia sp.]
MNTATMSDVARLLAGVPLLAGLPPARLAELAAVARPVTVRAGGWLLRRGERGDALFVVCTGRVEIVLDGLVVRT